MTAAKIGGRSFASIEATMEEMTSLLHSKIILRSVLLCEGDCPVGWMAEVGAQVFRLPQKRASNRLPRKCASNRLPRKCASYRLLEQLYFETLTQILCRFLFNPDLLSSKN